ncbi:MAG: hypothetical protein ACI9TA_002113, partial [Reinekea sp.]
QTEDAGSIPAARSKKYFPTLNLQSSIHVIVKHM